MINKEINYDNLELLHKTDVALKVLKDDNKYKAALNLGVDNEFYLPKSGIAEIILISDEISKELGLKKGDEVYYDPNMQIDIDELKLVIVDRKNLLLKK
jgi:hypothetical protein